jgi:hypothetical protein
MSLYHLLHHDNKGVRRFDAGGVTETTVSDWAAPVVGGIIQRGLEIAGTAPAVYGGATVAGASDLQKNAFSGIQGLTAPNTSQTNAGTNLQDVYKSAATQPGYVGTDFTGAGAGYKGPGYVGTDFSGAGAGYTGPAYKGTTFTSNTTGINNQFDQNALSSYMNPHLSTILNPQLAEAKRNASIEQAKNQAQMIKAGAFGGGGANYMNAESQRNLGTKLADITGKGYGDAYTAALGQYNKDQDRLLDALKQQEASGQYGYTKSTDQFNKDRTALLDSLKEKESSGQYGYTKSIDQFNKDRTALLDSLKEAEKAKEYSATSGLDYLKLAGTTAQNQGIFGNDLATRQLAANKQEADLGKEQRDIIQQGLKSDYEIWKEKRDAPKTNLDWFQKLISQYPMTTTNTYGQAPNTAASVLGGTLTATSAYDLLTGKKKPS